MRSQNVENYVHEIRKDVKVVRHPLLLRHDLTQQQPRRSKPSYTVRPASFCVPSATHLTPSVEFLPRHAKMAHYNSNSIQGLCMEGTRVDFLQNIYVWIDAARAQGFAVPSGMGGSFCGSSDSRAQEKPLSQFLSPNGVMASKSSAGVSSARGPTRNAAILTSSSSI